ncbi:type IV pilus modification PilV family protein [Pontiella agarivorans]|uniref:Prepilin-type N-terminal cleavage/methylation domain-containing protein n=1 Tax=Pontiella agarivorans TaxID=3038953 RepID=A0ABU5N1I0_9BACT|nr:prepilin-type N-terminal cleavage/methylation domain-containing protein [Pontiella agarivorans]MDZ8120309.1 prepilin-type N-terminal cleavage/methylation domain-containing protein [Pontiella agarivorans]
MKKGPHNMAIASKIDHGRKAARNGKAKKGGFTLIEVLVASFISVMAVSSAFMLLTQSMDILRSSSNRLDALQQTRGAVEYLRSLAFTEDELNIGNHTTTRNGQQFSYTVSKYEGDDNLKLINVRTNWRSEVADADRELELETVICAPLHAN